MKCQTLLNLEKLPPRCAARNPSDNAPIIIVAGEHGYHPVSPGLDVEAFNAKRGITPAQVNAMLAGSMFGWEVPAANPETWEEKEK